MRYAVAQEKHWQRELEYRIYVTDCLKALTGASVRYADFFAPIETRKAKDVIGAIRRKLRQEGGD